MPEVLIQPVDGLNRADAPHLIGNTQCWKLQNFLAKNQKITKFKGTDRYINTQLGAPIRWIDRYYGKLGSGEFVKRTFCYANDKIYFEDSASTTDVLTGGTPSSDQAGTPANAVDGDEYSYWTPAAIACYFRYDLGAATTKTFERVTIQAGSEPNRCLRNFAIKVSNDATTWTTLFIAENETGWVGREARTYVLNNTTAYRYLQIDIITINDTGTTPQVAEISAFEATDTTTLRSVLDNLTTDLWPESMTIQVAGVSRMYFMNGEDTLHYYEGASDGSWTESAITYKFQQGVEWLERLWAFEADDSTLYFSKPYDPENFTDSSYAGSIVIGNAKDSVIRRIELLGEYLFIFKNTGIYVIYGRTPATFQVRQVTDKFGLAAQRGLCKVPGYGIVFVNEFDKEIYSFGGTEGSIRKISLELEFQSLIDMTKLENICCIVHNDLFRLSFQHFEATSDSQYNSHEAIFPIYEQNSRGLPKWTTTKGANINCYSIWNRQGDRNLLVTGRSDTGLLMRHGLSDNWDNTAMELIMRTKEITPVVGYNSRFTDILLDGVPIGDKTVTFRYYLDTSTGPRGETEYDLLGAQQAYELIEIPTYLRFGERIVPVSDKSKGMGISCEIYDNQLDTKVTLYSIKILYIVREKKHAHQLVGG